MGGKKPHGHATDDSRWSPNLVLLLLQLLLQPVVRIPILPPPTTLAHTPLRHVELVEPSPTELKHSVCPVVVRGGAGVAHANACAL